MADDSHADDAAFYRKRILELLDDPDAAARVERYLDPTEPFPAFSFDTLGRRRPYDLTIDDLLALSLLDAPIDAMAYRRLMELGPEIGAALRKLDPDLHLWQLRSQARRDAESLRGVVTSVLGVDDVTASKLLARKRPKLFPIIDERVVRFFGGRTEDVWSALGTALTDRELRARIDDELRPPGLDTSALSLLRILDIAIWMHVGDG